VLSNGEQKADKKEWKSVDHNEWFKSEMTNFKTTRNDKSKFVASAITANHTCNIPNSLLCWPFKCTLMAIDVNKVHLIQVTFTVISPGCWRRWGEARRASTWNNRVVNELMFTENNRNA
jgi:hypothetical protein